MTHSSYRLSIRRAVRDIDEAAAWYDRQRQDLGHEFVAEVDAAIARAAANPFHHTCPRSDPGVRRVMTGRFPYRVLFVRRDDEVIVFPRPPRRPSRT